MKVREHLFAKSKIKMLQNYRIMTALIKEARRFRHVGEGAAMGSP